LNPVQFDISEILQNDFFSKWVKTYPFKTFKWICKPRTQHRWALIYFDEKRKYFSWRSYRADALTWTNGLKEFGDFEIITWELKT
jgi:hypothetical protein